VKEKVRPVTEFEVEVDGSRVPILEAPLAGDKVVHDADDPQRREHLVRVEWAEHATHRRRGLAERPIHEPSPGLQAPRPRHDRLPRGRFRAEGGSGVRGCDLACDVAGSAFP